MQNSYANKKIVVVGAGKSGRALCRFLAAQTARVTLSDQRPAAQIEALDSLAGLALTFDFGGHDVELFKRADLIVLSPGVPESIAAVQAAKAAGVPVVGEIEIAIRALPAPMIGITGTNGKSTVTALTGAILKEGGFNTYIGGNIGEPLTDAIAAGHWDWLVIELSSFQLETMSSFRPRYSMLLNLTPDHLDRYPDLDAYIVAKQKIFMNQTAADYMILNADDPEVLRMAAQSQAAPVYFSVRQQLAEGMFLAADDIVWSWRGARQKFPVRDLQLKGMHNIANVMAAMIPALLEGVAAETIWSTVRAFKGLQHRMNLVRTLDGVDWYNDSKGTNIGSVVMSLAGLAAPVTLIAGGKDKGGDFGELTAAVQAKVELLILIGEAAERIEREIGPVTRIMRVDSLAEAVDSARTLTRPGGTVLLSPGCASFDMFANYADRGEQFCRLVEQLDAERGVSHGNPPRI